MKHSDEKKGQLKQVAKLLVWSCCKFRTNSLELSLPSGCLQKLSAELC